MVGDIVTRRRLLHWYRPGHAHFLTYRLADTIPVSVLREWRDRRAAAVRSGPVDPTLRAAYRERIHKQFFAAYDRFLDSRPEPAWLADPRVAAMIRENLLHHRGRTYELLAWCVMSNHVHVVLQPTDRRDEGERHAGSVPYEDVPRDGDAVSDEVSDGRSPLSRILHSLKSYTANRANEILGRTGRFWQAESYDHWIRDVGELERVVDYVVRNPVEADLCARPQDWTYSSAHDRFLQDGSTSGLVGWLRDDWRT